MAPSPVVRQISECFIKPKSIEKEAQKIVHLAPWDLFMLSIQYIKKGLLFTKPVTPMATFLERLKHSLSTTLSHFYSLAGQLETQVDDDNHTCFIFINCNKGPGARFIHGTLDMTISDILSPTYRPEVVNSLFDHDRAINHDGHTLSLITVQVTELVDGVFIACSVNHACADGVSFWHFLNTWSEIFMADGDENAPISRLPVYDPWFPGGSGPIKLPYESPCGFEVAPYKERVYHFSAESISKLKVKANSDYGSTTHRISSFQALAAHVWRCITRARAVPEDEHTHCELAIDNRGRVIPPLSEDYFGNAADLIVTSCRAGELLQRSLGWVAMKLNILVANHDDKKIRSGIDTWMKDPRMCAIEYVPKPYGVLFVGSPRFDVYGVEFGMGKALAALNGHANRVDGKVVSSPGRDEEGSVDLGVSLPADSMRSLELDAEFVEAASLCV